MRTYQSVRGIADLSLNVHLDDMIHLASLVAIIATQSGREFQGISWNAKFSTNSDMIDNWVCATWVYLSFEIFALRWNRYHDDDVWQVAMFALAINRRTTEKPSRISIDASSCSLISPLSSANWISTRENVSHWQSHKNLIRLILGLKCHPNWRP